MWKLGDSVENPMVHDGEYNMDAFYDTRHSNRKKEYRVQGFYTKFVTENFEEFVEASDTYEAEEMVVNAISEKVGEDLVSEVLVDSIDEI